MKEYEIKEGDIVEIEYIDEFTKEHINEGKALVLWRGFNHQPLVHFPSSNVHRGITIWTSYNRISRVVGHVDIERYMENAIALEQEPCEDCISRQAVIDIVNNPLNIRLVEIIKKLPPVTPQPKTGYWISWYEIIEEEWGTEHNPHCKCSECSTEVDPHTSKFINHCPVCGAKMVEPAESEVKECR